MLGLESLENLLLGGGTADAGEEGNAVNVRAGDPLGRNGRSDEEVGIGAGVLCLAHRALNDFIGIGIAVSIEQGRDLLRDDGRGGHTGTAGKYDLLHVERPLAQRDGGRGPPAEYLVGAVGLEPTILAAEDFKSPAYANSATPPRA